MNERGDHLAAIAIVLICLLNDSKVFNLRELKDNECFTEDRAALFKAMYLRSDLPETIGLESWLPKSHPVNALSNWALQVEDRKESSASFLKCNPHVKKWFEKLSEEASDVALYTRWALGRSLPPSLHSSLLHEIPKPLQI